MARCSWFETCAFFNAPISERLAVMVESQKRRFCNGSSHECARLWLGAKHGADAVPADLFPSQMAQAREIAQELEEKARQEGLK